MARSYGNSGKQLLANIHMAYSAIYANNRKQAKRWVEQAKGLAEKRRDMAEFRKLEKVYNERKAIWDKS